MLGKVGGEPEQPDFADDRRERSRHGHCCSRPRLDSLNGYD
jgi:hypothetical protein